MKSLLVSCALVLATACASTEGSLDVVEADESIRAPMFDAVAGLEGRWVSTTPYGEMVHVFEVTSSGSAVRELMGPGTEHEMTNMYTLDGNSLTMTHYCGAGNQPFMRARALDGDRLEFEAVSVRDLKDPAEHYMGAMTLVFLGEDHVEQHWTSIIGEDVAEMGVFDLRRDG